MIHRASSSDAEFASAFEACSIPAQDFDHAAHVRLAYTYLCRDPADVAADRMKQSLLRFLAHLGIGDGKYHETLTRGWILAVAHFMDESSPCESAADFLAANPRLLDSRILLEHYSAEALFAPAARQSFVRPDRREIPPRRDVSEDD
jgi:hypothetical protein